MDIFKQILMLALEPSLVSALLFLVSIDFYRKQNILQGRTVALVGIFYWLLVFVSPVPWWLVRHLENRALLPAPDKTADAAVILGGGGPFFSQNYRQFELRSSSARLVEAARLYREGRIKWILLSSFRYTPEQAFRDELSSQAQFLYEIGVPQEKILIDDSSHRTFDHPRNVAALLKNRPIETLFLITSAIHMPRAAVVFYKASIDFIPYPVDFLVTSESFSFEHPTKNVELFRAAQYEYLAHLRYGLY